MRVTKHAHACLVLEEEGQRLVIDPGNQTGPLAPTGVVAIVITHEHADHWDAEHLRAVAAQSDVLRSASPTEIALDLADVEFIDARGVTALMRVRTLATDVGCVLRFDDAQPLVARVLQITGLLP